MSLVVFTGGARSGKSSAAQALASVRSADGRAVTYVVFGRVGLDGEFDERVARHRADRPAGFNTIEVARCDEVCDLDVPDTGLIVIDCVGTWLGLHMEAVYGSMSAGSLAEADAHQAPDGFEAELTGRFDRALRWVTGRTGDTIVITNEVGEGVVPTHAMGRVFRDVLGRANRDVVAHADRAYLCVAGRLIDLSEASCTPNWPED